MFLESDAMFDTSFDILVVLFFCVLFWSDRLCRGESCSAME